jgi:hypothetical protein
MTYQASKLTCALIALCLCSQVRAQQRAQLNCQGAMGDVPSVLAGVRIYSPYNALGDGYVKFAGQVSAGGIQGRIMYEGYTATAPFSGVITTPQGVLRIGVLDNTGGEFIIYEGTARIGAPQTLGRFMCRWE